jgi:hypothetical protein
MRAINELDRLCNHCSGGSTKMVQVPRTDTWICSVCSGLEWHYPEQLSMTQPTEIEEEYQSE